MARTRCFIFIACIVIPSYAIENDYNINSNSIFHNEFAVHIPAGGKVADEIASKYGYQNLGQIGSLENFYLFNHNRIRKRSAEPSTEYHQELSADPQVDWAEQQIERKRVKRDFSNAAEVHDDPFVRSHGEEEILHRERRQFFPNSFTNGFGRFSIFKAPPLNVSPIRRGSRRFPDPLYDDQWYLSEGAIGGHDMNVTSAWSKGYTGKGVVISILDDGIQHNHPDLAQNYDPRASTDINDNDPDPMPRDNGDNKHGTRCAGEVASVAFNDYCGVGIAYNASIGGVRMLDGTVNDAVEARAISLNPDHIDIYSASWGPEDDGKTVDGPGPLAKRAFINGVIRGRHGKGSIFVWASGNGGRHTDNCNCDGYTNSIFTLSISSASQRGLKPWYLEECSSTLASTYSSGTPGLDRSVATADMDGSLRSDRICTTDHTGTSASAPLAAGLCALALEANPDLSWRDMQHLVVRTSRMDPLHQEEGWFINGVGRHISHKFGYGLMDAGAMVDLAEKWTTVPPQHVCQTVIDRTDLTIPTIRGSTIQAEIITDGCAGTSGEVRYLEHVQAVVSLRFLPRGNINIRLISPSGTTSTLLFERPRDVLSEKFDDWPFLSVHFWGEKAAGSWRLLVSNAGSRQSSHPGVLVHWQLILHGTRENPERLRFGPNSFSPSFNQFGDLVFAGSIENRVYDALNSSSSKITDREKEDSLLKKLNKSKDKETFSTEMCHSECLGGCFGTGPGNCKSCKHFSLQNDCVSTCLEGTYGSDDKDCLPCHGSCAQCIGPRLNQCISCPSQTLFVEHMGICVDTCPVGYFAENGSCLMCSNQCAECNSSFLCLRCDHHLLLFNGSCHTLCPNGTFESSMNTCEKCDTSCETCVGETDEGCASCFKDFFLSKGKCVSDCPEGTVKDKSLVHCIPCQIGCSTCTDEICTSCENGWRLKSGICVAYLSTQCDINEFRNGSSCTPCHSACMNCIGPNEKECVQCVQPKLLMDNECMTSCPKGNFNHMGRCLSCPHGCSSCSGGTHCLACQDKFHHYGEKCLASCPLDFYSDRGKCLQCDSSCSSCWGPMKDQCFSCPQGSLLLDSTCRKGCPEGYYPTYETCLPCYHNCRDCEGPGLHSCISCREFLTLDGGMCLECRTGRYYNMTMKSCAACHDSCLSCNGMDENSCTTCQAPFSLHPATRTCRTCCASNVSEDTDSRCCQCENFTSQCIGSGTTDKRRIALSLPNRVSPKITPVSFFSSTTALVVIICLVNIVVFGAVFVLLQVRSSKRGSRSYSYKRLPLRTSSSTPLKISQTSLMMSSLGGSDEDFDGDECEELFTRT